MHVLEGRARVFKKKENNIKIHLRMFILFLFSFSSLLQLHLWHTIKFKEREREEKIKRTIKMPHDWNNVCCTRKRLLQYHFLELFLYAFYFTFRMQINANCDALDNTINMIQYSIVVNNNSYRFFLFCWSPHLLVHQPINTAGSNNILLFMNGAIVNLCLY